MKTTSIECGDYEVVIHVDDRIPEYFQSFELDQDGLAALSEEMGVPEALDRRLANNRRLEPNFVVDYTGESLGTNYRSRILGITHHPRRGLKKGPPADIRIAPITIAASCEEGDLNETIERTTIHEISHFVDETFDELYLKSSRIRRRLHKQLHKEQSTIAREHPMLRKDKDQLKELLPENKLRALATLANHRMSDAFWHQVAPLIDPNWSGHCSEIAKLDYSIRVAENYSLLPIELLAGVDVEVYREIGKFCSAHLKPETSRSKPQMEPMDALVARSTGISPGD